MIREKTSDRPRGIQWTLVSHLEESDFGDDLEDMSATQPCGQPYPGKMQPTKQTGLLIIVRKTQVIYVNAPTVPPITIPAGEELAGLHRPFHLPRKPY